VKLKRSGKTISVPIFSTSDIAFLLLIFIMLVSLINYRVEVKIDYPEAKAALRTTAEKNLEVWVTSNGDIFLDGLASDRLAFEKKVAELYISAPDTRIHIIADKNTPYNHINSVLEIMQILQYRVVSFVVKANE